LTGVNLQSLQSLIDPSEASFRSHLQYLRDSFQTIASEPLGHGLGTAGGIGHRYLGTLSIDNENWFLLLATEMGILSPVLYAAISIGAIASCLSLYLRTSDTWMRILALGVAAAGCGYLVESQFLHAWENTVVAMSYWLMVGIALRVPEPVVQPPTATSEYAL